MPISFHILTVGTEYERPQLAKLWGYRSHHAISRGVVTPTGTRFIVLFVTKEKQEALTQYRDFLEKDILHWEGEERHGSDARIVNSEPNGDETHLFYRERHHSPFVYLGRIDLVDHEIRINEPSRFTFRISALSGATEDDPFRDVEQHSGEFGTLDETERRAIVQSRVGQGRFRKDVLNLWGGCAVTGVTDTRVLKASHVKPWRDASNDERLDPHNGLALVPNLDALFDCGLITFDSTGHLRASDRIGTDVLTKLGIEGSARLRLFSDRLERYLQYHRQHVFVGFDHGDWSPVDELGDSDG
jgi:hypothetical protein